jgi:hypothetical protein
MRLVPLPLLLVCATACDGGRTVPAPGTPGSTRSDGGAPRVDASTSLDAAVVVAPPMGLALDVAASVWGRGGGASNPLTVIVTLANGTGATPASLAPAQFTLTTDRGLVISASEVLEAPSPCRSGLAVAAGASVSCGLAFDVPASDVPRRVDYVSGERRADAAVEACSATRPLGLCTAGQGCDRGACEPPCAPGVYCLGDTECRDGACVGACSATNPRGFCESGACRNGQCDASCHGFVVNVECATCIQASCMAANPNCDGAQACFDCAREADTCTCAEQSVCQACPGFDVFATCLIDNCPSCLR